MDFQDVVIHCLLRKKKYMVSFYAAIPMDNDICNTFAIFQYRHKFTLKSRCVVLKSLCARLLAESVYYPKPRNGILGFYHP